eukprot:TRINITY_DN249_c0_g1_i1.p1 TRINITY_DN249_c0_g1~~TRINITY_DN249_c0_g1_i1.p1  ORF type:complete len:151 (-),score=13.51 TRINITY_DN249_c0_g1_i1:133-585(-)
MDIGKGRKVTIRNTVRARRAARYRPPSPDRPPSPKTPPQDPPMDVCSTPCPYSWDMLPELNQKGYPVRRPGEPKMKKSKTTDGASFFTSVNSSPLVSDEPVLDIVPFSSPITSDEFILDILPLAIKFSNSEIVYVRSSGASGFLSSDCSA